MAYHRSQTYIRFFLSFRGHMCLVHHILGLAGPIDWTSWIVGAVTTSTSTLHTTSFLFLLFSASTNLSMFGIQLYDSFSVFLLQILYRGCCLGKQLFTILSNLLPILVSTFWLNTNIYNIMCLFPPFSLPCQLAALIEAHGYDYLQVEPFGRLASRCWTLMMILHTAACWYSLVGCVRS